MGVTQLNGAQVKDASIGVVDLSATGTPSATTYLRGDNTWASVTASQPDITQDLIAPSISETLTAGYSAVINRSYTIASGTKLTLGLGSRFRIL